MGLNTGGLNERLTILRDNGNTKTSSGYPVENFLPERACWCQVVELGGREFLASGREVSEGTARIYIRFFSGGLTVKDRITLRGKTWDVLNVKEIPIQDGYEITAQVRE